MKTTESKPLATATKKTAPFIQKKGNEGFFPGNTADSHFFSPKNNSQPKIQAKLTIGQPNDKYEQEADAVADRVVQRLSQPEVIQKRANDPATPVIQRKCAECEKEELQKKEEENFISEDNSAKMGAGSGSLPPDENNTNLSKGPIQPVSGQSIQTKPIFESDQEPTVQRKCETCEKEEKLQKKGDVGASYASPSLESRLSAASGGSPLPEPVRTDMENSMGADFSDVKIHTDSNAVQMSQELNAQAFTHGNDIYFNSGKFDPSNRAGQHLLAHELTHNIQQQGEVKRKPAGSNEKYTIQRYPKAGEILPITEKQRKYYKYRDDIVDIKDQDTFRPGEGLGNYIASLWEMGQEAAVNIKFGSMGEGFIFVKGRGVYPSMVCATQTGLFVDVTVCLDVPPDPKNYNADEQVIPIHLKAFKKDVKGTPVLIVSIKSGKISGRLGWVPNKKSDDIHPLVPAVSSENDFLPLIFGDDFTGSNFQSKFNGNTLIKGRLNFYSIGELILPDEQKIQSIFIIDNESYSFRSEMIISAVGLEESHMKIERDDLGHLLGKLPSLSLNKTWNFNELTASIHASFENSVLEILGTATYLPKDPKSRIKNAEATILVANKEKAWDEVRARMPNLDEKAAAEMPGLYKAGKGLTVVGWGSMNLSIVKKQDGSDFISGRASLILDPGGHITMSGSVRVNHMYTLMDPKGIDWEPVLVKEFGPFFATVTGFPAGVGLNFTGKGGLYYKYILGPLTLHDISILGVYSTNPIVNKELSVSGRLNISAELNGKVEITGRMAGRVGTSIPYFGFDVSAVELTVSGEASLKAYSDFASTLGVREVSNGGQKVPRAFIKGSLQIAGELSLILSGTVKFEVLYGSIADKTVSGTWPVAGAGAAIDFDYNIGDEISIEKLKEIIKFRKTAFDRQKFVKGVLKEKIPKGKGGGPAGGFFDDKGKKVGNVSDKPIPIPEENIPPSHIKDDFNMEGIWHYLDIEIGGPGQAVTLKMATTPALLSEKIRAQREKATIQLKAVSDDFTRKQLEQQISDLNDLQEMATAVIHRAQQMGLDPKQADKYSVPGLVQLGIQISRFGKRYKLNDLGGPSAGTPGGAQPSKDTGDGSYDFPIRIRWIKRGYHTPILLKPRLERWRGIKPPADVDINASYNSKTKLEVPPTQKRSFPDAKEEDRDGHKILIVEIGVDPEYQVGIGDRIKRKKSSKNRPMAGKFRTLLNNYHYEWSRENTGGVNDDDNDADHSLDLGWGGPDSLENLWPIFAIMNRGFANGVYDQQVQFVENGEVKNGTPRELIGKWFIIVSIGDVP